MNKKILLLTMSLLALVIMVTPVLAKPSSRGPLNSAGKNPNADYGWSTPMPSQADPDPDPVRKLDLMTPSGVINRWINYTVNTSRVVIKPDNKFKIPTAVEGTVWYSPFLPSNAGKWVHMSAALLQELSEHYQSDAPDIGGADGVYFKWKAIEK